MLQNLPIISRSGAYDAEGYFPGTKRTPRRAVLVYELELFLEEGGVAYINGESYPIRRGDVLLARPGDERSTRLPFRCFFLHFSFNDSALAAQLETLPRIFTPRDALSLEEEMRRVSRLSYSERASDEVGASGGLLALLARLLSETPSVESKKTSTILDARRYMEENYAAHLTLGDIAAHCHLSPIYFHTLFREALGMTPHEYLMQIRMDAARSLLHHSELSLSEIAATVGFGSQAYFTHCFRVRTGQTPRDYRRRLLYPDAE